MNDRNEFKEGMESYLSICKSIYERLQKEGKLDKLFTTKDTDKDKEE